MRIVRGTLRGRGITCEMYIVCKCEYYNFLRECFVNGDKITSKLDYDTYSYYIIIKKERYKNGLHN